MFQAAAISANSIAWDRASSTQYVVVLAAQTCRRPAPTSYRQETKAPSASAQAQGTHLPPGPSIGFPMLTFTAPGGGLQIRAELRNCFVNDMAHLSLAVVFVIRSGRNLA